MRVALTILLFAPLLGCFFLSGASALIYEVVWTRQLSLVFGVTLYAISAVLASFMGGLALGSWLSGRIADRLGRPAVWYGLCELGIAVAGALSSMAITALTPAYVWLNQVAGEGAPLGPIRFGAACLILLVPTGLMGATLPFMVKASMGLLSRVGFNVSLLYAMNTAGAALGALAAGFFLIGGIGFQGSVYVAAALNVLAGVLALAISRAAALRARPPFPSTGLREPPPDPGEEHGVSPGCVAPGWVLLTAGISGFCALAYEIIWFRVLDLFLNGTAYAFSIMLVTFLGGLALGSALVSLVLRRGWNWAAVLGVLEILIGIEALVSRYAVGEVPAWRDLLVKSLPLPGLAERPVFSMTLVAALVLLPLTILLGMTFPVAAQAVAQGRARVGAYIGSMNASNTVGAILGSLAGGLIIVPLLGSEQGLTLVAALNLAAGIGLCWLVMTAVPRLRWALPAAGLVLVSPLSGGPGMMEHLLQGIFRGHEVIWYEEGLENTVSVQKHPLGYQVMYINSRDQAFDAPGMVQYHQLVGQLPMVLHSNPKDVLVIGLGGGATPGAISRYTDSSIDIVELSPSVTHAAGYFAHINNDVLHQPNVHLIVDDGRNYLLLTRKKYDVITADIIQAHHAGSGNLYSREYFDLARSALKEGGIMVQWVNTGQTTLYPMITRTFLSVFPYATVWAGGTLLIGSNQPESLEPARLEARFRQPGVQAAAFSSFQSAQHLLSMYSGDRDKYLDGVGEGPLLTDDRPLTEYFRSAPGTEYSPELR